MDSGCGFLVYLIVPECLLEVVLEDMPGLMSDRHLFPLFTGFSIPSVSIISKYEIFTTFPTGIGVVEASDNSTLSSILSNNYTVGYRRYHY